MTHRIFRGIAALVAIAIAAPLAAADDPVSWASDDAEALYANQSPYDDALGYDQPMHYDSHVQPAQAGGQSNSRTNTSRTTTRTARTSRVPYMIGDSPSSSSHSSGVSTTGVPFSDVEHPIFSGNRLNVSENGIVAPTDRFFFTYRHFNGAFNSAVLSQPGSTDLEQFTVGAEKTALDNMISAGIRVPLVRQLNSNLDIFDIGDGVSNLPVTDRAGELGNLGVQFKLALIGLPRAGLTLGLAVNCPTAEDVYIDQSLYGPGLPIQTTIPVATVPDTTFNYLGQFENDTVNVIPFLAWYVRPTDRFFNHGFLQIDAPVNRSDATVHADGEITAASTFLPETFDVTETGEIDQQTLLRLNVGIGYWLVQNGGGPVDGLAAIFECHYTGTIEDANPFVVPVTVLESTDISVADVPITAVAGSTANDVDVVNLSTGLAANIGALQIINGVIVPVTDQANRSFNFEYSLQVNCRF